MDRGGFPNEATVLTKQGSVRISDVSVGQDICTGVRGNGDKKWEPVLGFKSFDPHTETKFTEIKLQPSKTLYVRPCHYIYAEQRTVLALMLTKGEVINADKKYSVVGINQVSRKGLYHPMTMSNVAYVDGVLVSLNTYNDYKWIQTAAWLLFAITPANARFLLKGYGRELVERCFNKIKGNFERYIMNTTSFYFSF